MRILYHILDSFFNKTMVKVEKYYKLEEDYQLLKTDLIKNLPSVNYGWNDKSHFGFRQLKPTEYILNNCKWLSYNEKWVNFLIFDIDNKNLQDTYNLCLELGFEPSFGCETDKGCQIFYKLENIVKYEWVKTISFIQDIKECLTDLLDADKLGSHRINHIWRNPLKTNFIFSNIEYSLNDFKEVLNDWRRNQKSINKQFKDNIRGRKIKSNTFNYEMGNRNVFLWFSGMVWSKNQNYTYQEIFDYIEDLNNNESKLNNCEKLPIKDIKSISKSIKKYNDNGKNNVSIKDIRNENEFKNSNMSFEKMRNITIEEYLKEKKLRQAAAGKRTNEIIKNDKEKEMTRLENVRKMTEKKMEKNKRKVFNLITGLLKDEYKKKNGNWNIRKICEDSNLNFRTVKRYVEEYEGK